MYFNKKPTKDNITNSIEDVVVDTVVGGTVNLVSSNVASKIVPVNYKSWIKPKKLVTIFTGNYTKKVAKQTMVDTTINYAINNSIEHTISSNNTQEPMIELFPSPFCQLEY